VERYSETFKGRDTCRTPMTWQADQPNGGFSGAAQVDPWLPVDPRHIAKAGLDQQDTQGSLFERNRAHLAWRKSQPALMAKAEIHLEEAGEDMIVFTRSPHDGAAPLLCAFNFSNQTQTHDGLAVAPWSAAFR